MGHRFLTESAGVVPVRSYVCEDGKGLWVSV
jgi:hypothetical protein